MNNKVEREDEVLIVKTIVKSEITSTTWLFGKDIPEIIKLSMFVIMREQLDKQINRMLGKL